MAKFTIKTAKEGRTSLGEHYRFSRYLPPGLRATAPGEKAPKITTAGAGGAE
jgi:hypothetical protein